MLDDVTERIEEFEDVRSLEFNLEKFFEDESIAVDLALDCVNVVVTDTYLLCDFVQRILHISG